MKYFIGAILGLTSFSIIAGGFTNAAVPLGIDLVQAGSAGFMLHGLFGNPSGCTVTDQIFVEAGHPQYKEIYSTVLAAYMAGKKVIVYSHTCKPGPWYSVNSTTYNTMENSGSLYIRNLFIANRISN